MKLKEGITAVLTSKDVEDSTSELAESMDRSRNWQVEGVRKAIVQAGSGDLVPHKELFWELREKVA